MDWNNDGRHDLLIGDGVGRLLVFLNTNTNSHPILFSGKYIRADGADIDVGERATPVVADWNGDGKKDLLSGSMDGSIRVFLNKGTDSEPVMESPYILKAGGRNLNIGSRSAPRVYDWNRDRLKDIVAGEMEGHVYLMINTGTDNKPVFEKAGKLFLRDGNVVRYPDQDNEARSRLFVTDWNNDGLNDLLSGGRDGRVILYLSAPGPAYSPLVIADRTWNQLKETYLKIKSYLRQIAGNYYNKFLKSIR
ncbi:MAG: VCBS repeat-containing protein [Nitrospiraceae bacterium]|nr:MAG: VCBS repeat-containing protein [Nitrospiraceae bacterium]